MSFDCVVGERTDGSPEGVDADVFIEVGTVVESNPFKLLEVTGEFLKFGETTATFLLDPKLDLPDPSALQLYALGNDLLFQP